jgi:hypothetical protein
LVNNYSLSQFHAALAKTDYEDIGQEVISVINYPPLISGLSNSLRAVENLIPYLKIVNPSNMAVWESWQTGIPFLIKVAENLEQEEAIKSLPEKRSRWHGKISTYKVNLLAAVEQPLQYPSDAAYVNPALAILLAAYRLKISDQKAIEYLNNLSDFVRRAVDGNAEYLGFLKRYIPPLTISIGSSWLQTAQVIKKPSKSRIHLYQKSIPSPRNMIVHLYDNLWELEPQYKPSEKNKVLNNQTDHYLQRLIKKVTLNESSGGDVFIDASRKLLDEPSPNRQSRPKINLFHKSNKNDNLDGEGLAPATNQIEVFEDTPTEQPMPLPAVQSLDIKYTNYRTAMDNQRLPWAWDCLNKFEIATIVEILRANSELDHLSAEDKVGNFLTWVMLLTGQNIKQILRMNLFEFQEQQSALMSGFIYRRNIQSPPYSFKPNDEQKAFLSTHLDYLDFLLPKPFPHLINDIGLGDPQTMSTANHKNISDYLGLSEESAELAVRGFLTKYRKRNIRLTIGRVQNVLSAEVMAVSGDPVITHMLTAIPTDMPPSGIYYTSFSEDSLRRVYQQAIKNIFGINN